MSVHVPSDNQQTTEATQDESSFQQVIPNISQQSLYSPLVAMGTSITHPYHPQSLSPEESLMTKRNIKEESSTVMWKVLIEA